MEPLPLSTVIETERLLLRFPREDEVTFVWDAFQYPGFNDGMLVDDPVSVDGLLLEHAAYIENWERGLIYLFTLRNLKSDVPIGRISVERNQGSWSVGFWIAPEQQGAGYATEALNGVLGFCFETLGLGVVEACHADWNIASQRVLETCGFRFSKHLEEGFEKYGEWIPIDVLRCKKDWWVASC